MKTKKYLFTTILFSMLSVLSFAQYELIKTVISSVVPNESNMVFLDLPGEVEIGVWDRNYIKVEIEVKTNLKNEAVFDYLKETGRYKVEKGYNEFCFAVLNLPNIKDQVSVNGCDLEESFKFKVTAPWDIDAHINTGKAIDITMDYDIFENEGNLSLIEEIKY